MSSLTTSRAEPLTSALADRARPKLSSWAGTALRLGFGIVLAIDAVLKWLPGYRSSYLAQLQGTATSQPAFLHGWFHFWIHLQSGAPSVWADVTGVTETALALVVLLGVARRPGYVIGAGYMLLVWGVGEGFGGPYASGATDIGAGIIYTLLFLTLLIFSPLAKDERLSLDGVLAARYTGWRRLADLSPLHMS